MRRLLADKRYQPHLGALLTPQSGNPVLGTVREHGTWWAADNAAFSHPDDSAFERLVSDILDFTYPGYSLAPQWVAVPDVVGNHAQTRALFSSWVAHWEYEFGRVPVPLAFVLQDGCTISDVPWDQIDAVFVGGSTEWKLGPEAIELCEQAKGIGKWVHVGRVNTLSRLRFAMRHMSADSVDGSGFSKFPDATLPRFLAELIAETAQPSLF
jgi:hypothetical protein